MYNYEKTWLKFLMMCHYIQVQSDEYSFLLYDSFERNMKGNEQKTCHGNEKLHVSNFIHVYRSRHFKNCITTLQNVQIKLAL